MRDYKTILDILSTKYKDVQLTYLGRVFGPTDDGEPFTESGKKWSEHLSFALGLYAINTRLGSMIEHPDKVTPQSSGFYLEDNGKEIWHIDIRTLKRERVFRVFTKSKGNQITGLYVYGFYAEPKKLADGTWAWVITDTAEVPEIYDSEGSTLDMSLFSFEGNTKAKLLKPFKRYNQPTEE